MQLKSLIGFAVGPIGSALIGLITVPVVAWSFTPADVGRLNVFQLAISFALLFSVLGLDQAYVREYHEVEGRPRLLLSCFLPGFLFLTAGVIGASFFSEKFAFVLYGIADDRMAWLTLFAFLVAYVSRFLSLILRMQERGWAYSASQVIPKLLSLALILCVSVFSLRADFHTLQSIVIAGLLAVLLVYGWNTRNEWRSALRQRVDAQELRKLLLFGLPLVLSGLAYWGLTATSTVALRHLSSLEELAIYSVTASFAGAAIIFQSIFATVWAPTVYKWVTQGVDMRKVDDVARHALVVVCLIMVAVGGFSWLADFLLPQHYRSVKYLLACAVAPSLLYTLSEVTTVGIGISRRTGWTVWITLVALLANLLLSWWLVPELGAAGAVLANGVSFFLFFVLRTEVSAALWRQFPRMKLYGMLGALLSVALAVAAVGPELPLLYPIIWIVVLLFVVTMLRHETKELFVLMRHHSLGVSK